MLAVMTYNVGCVLAVVGGLALSYFILGFSPAEVIVVPNIGHLNPSNRSATTNTM